MTADRFRALSAALLDVPKGQPLPFGWQEAIARRLGVSSATVRRWLANGLAPERIEIKMEELWIGPITARMQQAAYEDAGISPNRANGVYTVMRLALLAERVNSP